ncbi:MAG: phosphoglyceromutase [Chitinophagia bacterium]|nr:phosphoglyceromutase [Chitinophagia bacterium]
MKNLLIVGILFIVLQTQSQNLFSQNIIIITTDGFRWQELFMGADPDILNQTQFVKDTGLCNQLFGGATFIERRQKLLPFFWSVIANQGLIAGNRMYHNQVNVANSFKISYPGYQELLTGNIPTRLNPNWMVNSKRATLLEKLNQNESFAGKVAAFASWSVIPFIMRAKHTNFTINAGYDPIESATNPMADLLNQVFDSVPMNGHTRNDLITYLAAKSYLEKNHPKVLFLGFGETDEYAHQGKYDQYLFKAKQFDQLLMDLWYFIQSDAFYKNNTTLYITTDHGRGCNRKTWKSHGFWIKGSGEIWTAMIGSGVEQLGELKNTQTTYLYQLAAQIINVSGIKLSDTRTNEQISNISKMSKSNEWKNHLFLLNENKTSLVDKNK